MLGKINYLALSKVSKIIPLEYPISGRNQHGIENGLVFSFVSLLVMMWILFVVMTVGHWPIHINFSGQTTAITHIAQLLQHKKLYSLK